MKCINCGNKIQDGLNVCPECGTDISSQVPITPTTPVLPQDQDMVLTSDENDIVEESMPTLEVETSILRVEEEIDNNDEPIIEGDNESIDKDMSTPVDVETFLGLNGEKIGSSAPVIGKKKSKKGLIITIILILLVIIGAGVFIYFYEFKSADKRLEILAKNLFSVSTKINNNQVGLSSGKYEISGKMSSEDEAFSLALNGNYAVDLKNELLDFTVNATSLNIGEELLSSPLNLELYLNDSKMYLLLQNFYDKYIYVTVPEVDELFKTVNDINYSVLANGLQNALTNSLKAAEVEQKIEDITIDGKKHKANVIRIVWTANNQEKITTEFYRTLANDKDYVAECAKIVGISEEEMKKQILENLENQEYEEEDSRIEIYSALLGDSLYGIKILDKYEDENYIFEVYPIDNGYAITGTSDGQTNLKIDIKISSEANSKTVTSNTSIEATISVEEKVYKLELNVNIIKDVEPKVEKVNVENSIGVEDLTEEDMQTILNKILSFGNLESLQKYLSSTTPNESCANAFNCQISADGVNYTCNICEDGTDTCLIPEVTTCPLS